VLERRLSQDDGSVFLERTLDLKNKDGAHILYAGKRAYRGQTGLNEMKPVMADEEVSTQDSDGRSCFGSTKNAGENFSFL